MNSINCLKIFCLVFAFTIMAYAADEPIRIVGPELTKLDFKRTDGGLSLAEGSKISVVLRANREEPSKSEGLGYTYNHHQDIAIWKGRLYVGWNSGERDEDTWPSRELFSTSTDGEHWSKPAELFPQGVSTPLRIYFFHAPNGRMLAIAGLRVSHKMTNERNKGPLVVREIQADHTLGPVFTLQPPTNKIDNLPANFSTADDAGFVDACKQLLSNHLFLLQQDYGNLLAPSDRMKWNDPVNWVGSDALSKAADFFGKAPCFFRRADGAMVSVSKRGWVTVSTDRGKTWPQPVIPSTLVTGGGKVWGQRIADNRYILVYNPQRNNRWPLAIVTSKDGITFSDMRTVHSELPPQRYPGKYKDLGASYVRGISAWSSDGSRNDNAIWLVFSVNKEDIWVCRLP